MTKPITVLLATQNEKKRKELTELAQGALHVLTPRDVGLADVDVDESGFTFDDNATLKARGFLAAWQAQHPHTPPPFRYVIADDSGIVVDALDGAPGVRSARFAADHAAGEGDAANNRLLLAKLAGVDDHARTARFVCHVAVLHVPSKKVELVFGRVLGRIAHDEKGAGGFGYDPLFLPDLAPGRRMAELSSDEKHAISHRGHAMREVVARLARASHD
jgi:XTP/dITP diphosphohydrolase